MTASYRGLQITWGRVDPIEGASCTAGPDVAVVIVVILDVAAILDDVLPDGVEDAGGVGTDC